MAWLLEMAAMPRWPTGSERVLVVRTAPRGCGEGEVAGQGLEADHDRLLIEAAKDSQLEPPALSSVSNRGVQRGNRANLPATRAHYDIARKQAGSGRWAVLVQAAHEKPGDRRKPDGDAHCDCDVRRARGESEVERRVGGW